jgi:hypothetical protein
MALVPVKVDLSTKTCVVTGASGGIGRQSRPATWPPWARPSSSPRPGLDRADAARAEIVAATKSRRVLAMKLDYGNRLSLKEFADTFAERHEHLHILVHSAATWSPEREQTETRSRRPGWSTSSARTSSTECSPTASRPAPGAHHPPRLRQRRRPRRRGHRLRPAAATTAGPRSARANRPPRCSAGRSPRAWRSTASTSSCAVPASTVRSNLPPQRPRPQAPAPAPRRQLFGAARPSPPTPRPGWPPTPTSAPAIKLWVGRKESRAPLPRRREDAAAMGQRRASGQRPHVEAGTRPVGPVPPANLSTAATITRYPRARDRRPRPRTS